jgi:hypothetical protein
LALVLVVAACSSPVAPVKKVGPYPLDHVLRMNQIQVLGTHNSYHRRPSTDVPGFWTDYEHPPLRVQLGTEGIRSVELDVSNVSGFSVEHDPFYDDRSNCPRLADCLGELKRWSDAHPRHAPIFVLLEAKDPSAIFDPVRDKWDAKSLDRLDDAVRAVFTPSDLITPDDVRGHAPTLRDAIMRTGWPTLARARGKFVVLLNRIKLRRTYLDGHPSLEGRAMFVPAYTNAPSAAIVERDDPFEHEIHRLVRLGFIVRTRADADGVEAKADDLTRSNTAIRSGAQIVSTDYPVPDPSLSKYFVRLPDGRSVACNPVNAPKRCRPRDVEKRKHR